MTCDLPAVDTTVRYYVDVSLSQTELEQLVDGDPSPELSEKLSGHLEYVRGRVEALERAAEQGVVSVERLRWNAAMNRLFEAPDA